MREGWIVQKLDDICNVEYGTRVVQRKDGGNKYPVYGGGGATFCMDIHNRKNQMVIARFAMSKQCTRFVPGEFFLNDSGLTISPKDIRLLLPQFLNYQILFLNDKIYSLGKGTAQKNLDVKLFRDIEIRYSKSLYEQQQIVSILDEAFAAIDKAKANIERNLQNAKDLFQSELNAVFSQKGEGWVEKRLDEITTKIGSGATPRGGQGAYKTIGISLVRSMNVHDEGFKEKNLAFIDDVQANALSNVVLEKNDILLNITGASVARCTVVPDSVLPARVNQHVSIIRVKKDIINHQYLHFLLTSKTFKDKLLGIGEQGATRQAITKAQLQNFWIKFPVSLENQEKIIKQLFTLSIETKKLEKVYKRKLINLEDLKKSILQKAFSGELKVEDVEAVTA